MKKNISIAIISALLFCLSFNAGAVPAKPGKIIVTQPDGSTIVTYGHGDEWFHWTTDENGNYLEMNSAGYLVKSSTITDFSIRQGIFKAQEARRKAIEMRHEALTRANSTIGSPKIPVVLVQFSDKKFTLSDPISSFDKLLNEVGYSENGGTGSVYDYYKAQSRGAYTPQFVVLDVVTLSGSMSTYGADDDNAAQALFEAVQSLDSSVDFSQFDNDGDNVIDMVLMYYAGYNEAENTTQTNLIWPHQYYVTEVVDEASTTKFDGVTLYRYFCTSELKGTVNVSTTMCGIGTTCHEFAHSLGLPDFYDTNYDNYGDGYAGATYDYDLMCSGPYNNDGTTPPWMGAEELIMLGWMDSFTEMAASGTITIPSIGADDPVAYMTKANDAGSEYFIYECRPGTGWDAPLQPGMIVYHVDKNKNTTVTFKYPDTSGTTRTWTYNASTIWNTNFINANGSHPCFYLIPAASQSSLYYSASSKNIPFPGSSKVSTYTPVNWDGDDIGYSFTGITFNSSDETVTMNAVNSNAFGISGTVMDSDGVGLSGATVELYSATSSLSTVSTQVGSRTMTRLGSVSKVSGTALQTTTTDASGNYSFDIETGGTYEVTASLTGYVSKTASVVVSRVTTQNFYLLREGEEAPSELATYPEDTDEWGNYGFGEDSYDLMIANIYPATTYGKYSGKQIKTLSFKINGDDNVTGTCYAIIDFGTERQLTLKLDEYETGGEWTTVDLLDYDLFMPSSSDVYAGFGMKDWNYTYPFYAVTTTDTELIGYAADFDETSSTWEAMTGYVFAIKITIGDYVTPDTGYNYISDPNEGVYSVGDVFDLTLVETSGDRKPDSNGVTWYYDDEPVSGSSVSLTSSGSHTITAKFTTSAGDKKVVELEITVQ